MREARLSKTESSTFAMEIGVSLSKCLVVLGERSLVLGELVDDVLEPFERGLAGCVLRHGFKRQVGPICYESEN